jgi:hypothetical protein
VLIQGVVQRAKGLTKFRKTSNGNNASRERIGLRPVITPSGGHLNKNRYNFPNKTEEIGLL